MADTQRSESTAAGESFASSSNQTQGGEPQSAGRQAPRSRAAAIGNDAVCFTAGFAGAMFGAGAIHAYLASDRKPPQVVAGISMGALNAAAMQRCYRELQAVRD